MTTINHNPTTGTVPAFELQLCGVIVTKFLSPTNHRGARVKATSAAGRTVTLSWDYELCVQANHAAAAATLAASILGTGSDRLILRGGCTRNDDYAFAIARK